MSTHSKAHKAKREAIGIDLDDVLFEFNDTLHRYHNEKYGTSVERSDVTTYDIEKIWGCTPEEAAEKIFEFCKTADHDEALPVDGATAAVDDLSKKHVLHLISSRGDQIRDLTLKWIDKNFKGKFESIHLTNQYFGIPEKRRTKEEVCKELGIAVMVEDSMSQAIDISASGLRVLLMDRPWNQGKLPQKVQRVYSWKEITRILL